MDTTNVKLIDLGLPSGTLWADRNIGADSPEDTGLYFQWGDTQGYTAGQCGTGKEQKAFDWNNYKYGTSRSNLAKYNTTDGKTQLDPEDDAAKVNMGSKYSMPTKGQFIELFSNTTQKLVLSDGTEILPKEGSDFVADGYFDWAQFTLGDRTIKGMKVIGSNGNELFFPASGLLADGSARGVGAEGLLWSASRYRYRAGITWNLLFGAGAAGMIYVGDRCLGLPIRAVANNAV